KIVNVALGEVSATSTDAINGSQLNATDQALSTLQDALENGGVIDPGTGQSLAVTYSNATKNIISLGNLGTPVEVMNVATGLAGSDAVNVDQLDGAITTLTNSLSASLRYVKVNATGSDANATGPNAVAIGSTATASITGAVAIGTGARALGANSVAIGINSLAAGANTVSVGNIGSERKIINVDDGDYSDGSTDAINGGQLFTLLGALNRRMGVLDVTQPLFAIEGVSGDNTASLNGGDANSYTSMAFGVGSFASGIQTVAFGLSNSVLSDNSAAIGVSASTGTDEPYSAAIGSNVSTTGSNAVAIGSQTQANADYAVAIGTNNAYAIGTGTVAIGNSARANKLTDNSIAIGSSASVAANVTDAVALGNLASVSAGAIGGVALGQGAVANRGNAVSLGNPRATPNFPDPISRQIINVAAGTEGTDAVIINQLQGVAQPLGIPINIDGSIGEPTYTIDDTGYHTIAEALDALAGLSGSDPNAVSYDEDSDKDTVTLGGTNGTLLQNVTAGSVADDSMDAINGSQLFDTALSIATTLGGNATVNADGTVSEPV
ncbi:hypothetical protein DWU98_21320, partial [Dyella monticola]